MLRVKAVQANGRNLVERLDLVHGKMPPGWLQRATILAAERAALAPLPPQPSHYTSEFFQGQWIKQKTAICCRIILRKGKKM